LPQRNQKQMKTQSKKTDRGQQHGKKEPTVALDKNDFASMENVAGVKEDAAAAQNQKQMTKSSKKTDRGQQHGKKEPTLAYDKNGFCVDGECSGRRGGCCRSPKPNTDDKIK